VGVCGCGGVGVGVCVCVCVCVCVYAFKKVTAKSVKILKNLKKL
jgi:predicted small secreted protein